MDACVIYQTPRGSGQVLPAPEAKDNLFYFFIFYFLFIFNVYLQPCGYDRPFPLFLFILQTPGQRPPFFFSISALSRGRGENKFLQMLDNSMLLVVGVVFK